MANMSYSSYGLTKSIGEKITSVLGGVTVKFWNVYGVEHDPEKTHAITDFINKARNTGVINMLTDGFILTDVAGFTAKGYNGLFTSPRQVTRHLAARDADAAAHGRPATYKKSCKKCCRVF